MGGEEGGLVVDVPARDDVCCEVDKGGVGRWAGLRRERGDAGVELRCEEGLERGRGLEEELEDGDVGCWSGRVDEQVDARGRESVGHGFGEGRWGAESTS